jgi:long-chain acyl-CoA synthetase
VEQLDRLIAGTRQVASAELKERVMRAVAGFAALGVKEGDRVAILMRNDLPQVEATLAAQHLGAYPVQVNWHSKADEIKYVLGDCAPAVLVAHADLLASAGAALPDGLKVIGVVPPPSLAKAYRVPDDQLQIREGVPEWESWLAAQTPSSANASQAVESIIYTSGTTGWPKGVRRFAPGKAQQEMTERMRLAVFGIGPGARVLVPAPIYHTAPNLFALRAVRKAELLVLPDRFDAEGLLADIERHRITHLYVVPTIFVRLLNLPQEVRARYDISSLGFALHAGGPCPPSVKKAMLDWWGPIIHEYYGSTEAGPSTFVRGDEWLERPGTVGRAVDGVRIEVRDEQGRALGPGEAG